jgi:hypothetical protein
LEKKKTTKNLDVQKCQKKQTKISEDNKNTNHSHHASSQDLRTPRLEQPECPSSVYTQLITKLAFQDLKRALTLFVILFYIVLAFPNK